MTFAEYIHDKLRYFLHGKDPSICTCDEMIQHMYDVEPSKELEYVVNILHGLSSKECDFLREGPDAQFMDQHAFPLRYKKLVSVWRGRSRRAADPQLSSDSLFRESLSYFAKHNGMSREEVIELLTDTCNEISECALRDCWEEHLPIDSREKSKIRKAMSEVRQKTIHMFGED